MSTVAKGAAIAAFAGLTVGHCFGICGCAGPNPICSSYWNTPVLFVGHVVRIVHVHQEAPVKTGPNGVQFSAVIPESYIVYFDVIKSYRGNSAGQQVILHTDESECHYYEFHPGRDYLVHASIAANGELNVIPCMRTHEVTNWAADSDVQWLEALPTAPAGGSIFGQIVRLQLNARGGQEASALPGVVVSIRGPQTKTVASDPSGSFQADGLPPGQYILWAAAPNRYTPLRTQTVTLHDRGCAYVGWSTTLDADETPGSGVKTKARLR